MPLLHRNLHHTLVWELRVRGSGISNSNFKTLLLSQEMIYCSGKLEKRELDGESLHLVTEESQFRWFRI